MDPLSTPSSPVRAGGADGSLSPSKKTRVPLVSEINDLIEKERTLLELKLLDKNLEAEEWKTKYEALKEKICDDEDSDLKKILAMEESEDYDPKDLQTATMRDIVANRIKNNVADLTGLRFSPSSFSSVVKALFGVRSAYPYLRIACVRNCDLTHANAEAVAHLTRSIQTDALDISGNFLDDVSFIGIVEVLKNRKNTPQYLLLDKNRAGGHAGTLFCTMLQHLTENTWGLAVSLPDMVSLPVEVADRAARRKVNRPLEPATVGDNNAYKDLVKHPHAATHFLNTLYDVLLAHRDTMGLQIGSRKERGAKTQSGAGRAQKGLARLHTLAVTQHMLSRRSVQALDKVLAFLVDSLTDLDLSFSYMGPTSVSIIAAALLRPDCQLLRLGLRGNLLGDFAACQVLQVLPKNSSLTYLDLAHNALTDQVAAKILALLPIPHLHCLDLCGNDIGVNTVAQVQSKVYGLGLSSLFLFSDMSARPPPSAALVDHPDLLFVRPHAEMAHCRPGGRCCLQAVHLARLRANSVVYYPMPAPPLRPVRVALQLRFQPSPHCPDLRALHALGEAVAVRVDFVALHRERRSALYSISVKTPLALRDGFARADHAPWHLVTAVLPALPEVGTLRVELCASKAPELAAQSFAVETRLVSLSRVDLQSHPWQFLGGDSDDMDADSLCALQQQIFENCLPEGEQLLRAMRYPCTGPKARVTFTAKLVAPGAGDAALGAAKARSLQYVINISRMTPRNVTTIATLPYEPITESRHAVDGEARSENVLLGAWKSSPFSVELAGLRSSDHLIVSARVVSTIGGQGAGKVKVRVQLSNCKLWTFAGDLLDSTVPSAEDITLRLAHFADPNEVYSF